MCRAATWQIASEQSYLRSSTYLRTRDRGSNLTLPAQRRQRQSCLWPRLASCRRHLPRSHAVEAMRLASARLCRASPLQLTPEAACRLATPARSWPRMATHRQPPAPRFFPREALWGFFCNTSEGVEHNVSGPTICLGDGEALHRLLLAFVSHLLDGPSSASQQSRPSRSISQFRLRDQWRGKT